MKFVLHYIAEYKWYAILAPLFKMLEARTAGASCRCSYDRSWYYKS